MMSDGVDNGPIYDKIISLDGSLQNIWLNVAVNDLSTFNVQLQNLLSSLEGCSFQAFDG